MKLDDIDEAVMLRNHRACAAKLSRAAEHRLIECTLWHEGEKLDVFSVLNAGIVRSAIIQGCDSFIAETDKRLAELGVEPPPPAPEISLNVAEGPAP